MANWNRRTKDPERNEKISSTNKDYVLLLLASLVICVVVLAVVGVVYYKGSGSLEAEDIIHDEIDREETDNLWKELETARRYIQQQQYNSDKEGLMENDFDIHGRLSEIDELDQTVPRSGGGEESYTSTVVAKEVELNFSKESVNQQWADEYIHSFLSTYNEWNAPLLQTSTGYPAFGLTSLECKTTICRVEVERNEVFREYDVHDDFTRLVQSVDESCMFTRGPADNGNNKTVYYVVCSNIGTDN